MGYPDIKKYASKKISGEIKQRNYKVSDRMKAGEEHWCCGLVYSYFVSQEFRLLILPVNYGWKQDHGCNEENYSV